MKSTAHLNAEIERLQRSVEEQALELNSKNRELEIEAALERVRARAMAMHKSEELVQVVQTLDKEILGLGIEVEGTQIMTDFADPEKGVNAWLAVEGRDYLGKLYIPYIEHSLTKNLYDASAKGVDFYSESYSKDEKNEYIKLLIKYSDFRTTPKERQDYLFNSPGWVRAIVLSKNSILSFQRFSLNELSKEEEEIFKRFGKVFEQAYVRFLDLQKLEEQARETQIEVALEKVRSASMAMHKSEDLSAVVKVVHEQITELDFRIDASNFQIYIENSKDFYMWAITNTHTYQQSLKVSYIDFGITKDLWDAKKKGDSFVQLQYDANAMRRWWKKAFEVSDLSHTPQKRRDIILSAPGWTSAVAMGKNCALQLHRYDLESFTNQEHDILCRLVSVFEQSYTRFLDLKKAEEQAREAQIEAVLEKIRSRSLAMQSQDELADIINLVLSKLQELGIENGGEAGIIISKRGSKTATAWLASPDLNFPVLKFFYPISPKGDFAIEKLFFDAQEKRIEFAAQSFTFEEKNTYWEWAFKNSDWRLLPEERKTWMLEQVSFDLACAVMENSALYLPTFTGQILSDEQGKVLVRFARVFEQAYVRFLDLQKAEAQAREAVKQSSLDRVRGEIASMRDAKDLERITPLVWSELKSLGVPFFRCGVMIANEAEEILDFYLSNPEGEALAALHLDYANSEITRKGVDHWRKKETYIEHWDQEQFLAFMKSLMDQGQISNQARYQGGEKPPESLTLQFVPFTQGMVYVGSESDLSEEELDLVKALGKSLSVAYARYEDFTKLDLAKAKAEKALNDLKAAQEQLVQQEKLASLGQLTAGIAHEIKNPLNFVNNFSDLSRELIDEVFLELENIEDSDAKGEITAILNDVKSNLTKVHEHGSRADSIVTSMLQHSRASGSKREAKAFNPLVKEFVNLSYHGMRAGKAPINVDIDLQLDPKVGDVTLISEDFSRVILNLCNNAFDAIRDKFLKTGDGRREKEDEDSYLPKLTVKTSLQKDKVLLSIADNGGGIPEEIKDKILQPFFTTKKGTEGTGLGLSITNDIIKAHGAGLKVESTLGKGTEFIIQLPLV